MGGLFSSDTTPPPQPRNPDPYQQRYYVDPVYNRTTVCLPTPGAPPRPSWQPSVQTTTSRPYVSQPATLPARVPTIAAPRPQVSRLPLMPVVQEQLEASAWDFNPLPRGASFRLVDVPHWDEDYEMVKEAFKRTTQKHKIIKVERVENPFLLGCYLLKKEEMEKRYGVVDEQINFHGTKASNVGPICENNFNWKLHGGSTGHRFGQGVSFSPISYYASHYSDQQADVKVMFYVRVLVSHIAVGDGEMILPPKMQGCTNLRFDTTGKDNGHVIVKFSDNEFYPEFIIHYSSKSLKRTTILVDGEYDDCAIEYVDPCDEYYY